MKTNDSVKKVFDAPAVKVMDHNKSAVRMAARKEMEENPVSVEGMLANVKVALILTWKRDYYELAGNALMADAREALRAMPGQMEKIEDAKTRMNTLIKKYNWESLAKVKKYARGTIIKGKCLFDAGVTKDGKLTWDFAEMI